MYYILHTCVFVFQTNSDIESYSWLLAAVMQALCHPSIKLSTILPTSTTLESIDSSLSTTTGQLPPLCQPGKRLSVPLTGGSTITGQDDNTGSVAQRRDSGQFPLLISYMCQRFAYIFIIRSCNYLFD